MKLAMTLMVRDEADIIGPMLEHHLAQGVDVFIITDNASIDGTREIIEEFAKKATVDLRHDPEHRKQQLQVVTQMARDAATLHGADWVLNSDADEFWFPVDRTRTLHDVFENISTELGAFTVPVTNLIGAPARAGSGLNRLIYRDLRPVEQLHAVGLLSHPTPNVAHVADPTVRVEHGNHYVSIASHGEPDPADAIEVLHLPWRSWGQFARKVENAGKGFENNMILKPSPNHHGMRDYRRLKAGTLVPSYLLRHPTPAEFTSGLEAGWFEVDESVASENLPGVDDVLFDPEELETQRRIGDIIQPLEERALLAEIERDRLATELAGAIAARDAFEAQLNAQLNRRLVRIADSIARPRPARQDLHAAGDTGS